MRYGEFTFGLALKKLKIEWVTSDKNAEYQKMCQEFIPGENFSASELFLEEFSFGLEIYRQTAVHSELMLKTHLIWPFLREIWKKHRKLHIWQGTKINVEEESLYGEPDYFVTKENVIPDFPYCVIVEAKKENFERGWGQALAAMYASQNLNRRESVEIPIYGVVSTGIWWQFGKLVDTHFVMFPEAFINILENDNYQKVLNFLEIIFTECEKAISATHQK